MSADRISERLREIKSMARSTCSGGETGFRRRRHAPAIPEI
jgi:hypothetical protein